VFDALKKAETSFTKNNFQVSNLIPFTVQI